MRPVRIALVATILLLLTACGTNPPPKAAPPASHRRSAPTSSATPTQTLMPEVADAYKAAAAAYPHVNLDLCTTTTPLTDQACGAALTAASNVATATETKLSGAQYAAVNDAADKFVSSLNQLELPIPCYGLSSAAQPPPQLAAEAQGICGEAASIAKVEWNIFLSDIEIYSGYKPQ